MIQSISKYSTMADATSPTQATAQSGTTDPLANKQVFLQLLVAQLKNQDPLQPQDGIQFVTQLAQFTQLEQSTEATQDLDAIKASLTSLTTPTTTGGN